MQLTSCATEKSNSGRERTLGAKLTGQGNVAREHYSSGSKAQYLPQMKVLLKEYFAFPNIVTRIDPTT